MTPQPIDDSIVLTDATGNVSVKEWSIRSQETGTSSDGPRWSVTKRLLSGGRQEGVEVIEVDNGLMKFMVVPTRGLHLWAAKVGDLRLGWDSPVKEIVHPQFVNLAERGGLGWLNGFGEWVSRCGLESMGPPCIDGNRTYTLHGRINYLPASYVEVRLESNPVPRIVLRGIVDESLMFGPHLRLTTEISTEIGQPALSLDDTVTNLSDAPQEMESLYHANFGPPLLGPGAQFVAPVKKVAPRDARAAECGMAGWNVYTGPHAPGYTEEVYLMELYADDNGLTEALLKSADGKKGGKYKGFSLTKKQVEEIAKKKLTDLNARDVEHADRHVQLLAPLRVTHEAGDRRVHREDDPGVAREAAELLSKLVRHPELALEVDLAGGVAPLLQDTDRLRGAVARRHASRAEVQVAHQPEATTATPASARPSARSCAI